jgi:hypothetical protein
MATEPEPIVCETCDGEGGWYDASRQWETCYRCNSDGTTVTGSVTPTQSPTQAVLVEVAMERRAQDARWGEQNHEDPVWALILGEEFGEACQAALQHSSTDPTDLRAELIQVAAVAVAWVESMDRRPPCP